MLKYFISIFLIILSTNTHANNKDSIVENLKKINNLNFRFEQNNNGNIENGNCTIKYPNKIFCQYAKSNNKVLVSNGKSLVVKTRVSYYRYPLEKTPLNLILDKEFLINKIYNLDEKIIDGSLINYTIIENNNEINIFFDSQTFNLIGWQTKDIYQNLNITFLSSIKKNRYVDDRLFKIPFPN